MSNFHPWQQMKLKALFFTDLTYLVTLMVQYLWRYKCVVNQWVTDETMKQSWSRGVEKDWKTVSNIANKYGITHDKWEAFSDDKKQSPSQGKDSESGGKPDEGGRGVGVHDPIDVT